MHDTEPDYIIVLSGLSSHRSTDGRSKDLDLERPKTKTPITWRYVSADGNLSERVLPKI